MKKALVLAVAWVGGVLSGWAQSPTIAITNSPATVPYAVTQYDLGGSSAYVVGEINWTNALTGEFGTTPADANWIITGISLGVGDNFIDVSGTNETGVATNDSITITRAAFANTIPYIEPFEGYANGQSLLETNPPSGWSGSAPEDALFVTNLSYLAPYYVLQTNHTRVAVFSGVITNHISPLSPVQSNVAIHVMLQPGRSEVLPTNPANSQMALCVNSNGSLAVWHGIYTNFVLEADWAVLDDVGLVIETSQWIRLTINLDYLSDTDTGLNYFQIMVDDKGPLTNAMAYETPSVAAAQPGTWFLCADDTVPEWVSAIVLQGSGALDDLVVDVEGSSYPLVPNSVTVVATAAVNGVISPAGNVTVPWYGETNFTITANSGYRILDIVTNGISIGWTFDDASTETNFVWTNITGYDTMILALFTNQPASSYTITASAGANGSIAPSGAVVVPAGGETNFVVTADLHYRIADIQTNSQSLGWTFDNDTLTTNFVWSNVSDDGTIYAAFTDRLTGNGTPHAWLASFGLATDDSTNGSMSDLDQDGLKAWEEFVCKTLPNDPNSVLKVVGQARVGTDSVLQWLSESGLIYNIEGATNLLTASWQFITNVSATPPTNTWTLPLDALQKFYRVMVSN